VTVAVPGELEIPSLAAHADDDGADARPSVEQLVSGTLGKSWRVPSI
jgi:hypothetical protein